MPYFCGMLEQFREHINTSLAFLKEKRLLIACSGGVDSMVLTHLCASLEMAITLAHCNFKLRGDESDGDEAFVKKMGKEHQLEVFTRSFDTKSYAETQRGSIQMAARQLRYQWFQELLDNEEYDYILTAHHADDSLETFLINLSRGTGIEGLTGIPEKNEQIIRPLLHFSREEMLTYAKAQNLQWREDSSNKENKYLRNKIRMEIVPKLKELHPTFLENFKQTQEYLAQTQNLLEHHVQEVKQDLFVADEESYIIDIEKLQRLNPIEAYLYGIFHDFGFTEWDNVKNLLCASSGKEVFSKTHRLLKDRTHLILSPLRSRKAEKFQVFATNENPNLPVSLKFHTVDSVEKSGSNVIFLDKEKLNFPLVLRNWEKGDYFYPFGMKGKKKLSKFFKDEKVDIISKEKQWLLCSNDEIVWVLGRRADERFKVDDTTQDIVKITLIA
ncbi:MULTISPECIES: tRNA lysidine(34) synthetase TilS [Flavobacteriaceae]|uniref:tRNA lysidine(34) synthetase TilS n=1 Tax=Flavobacteriaceae TaxID=49546 RepID=UPI001FEB895E|nr:MULTISPECIES: tRNA lysidine(34) synthetase TilS [Allomuricauda]MDC6364845.1 tRNA lysidine(34) synthetase TilS [Muricauda sp. AC10]